MSYAAMPSYYPTYNYPMSQPVQTYGVPAQPVVTPPVPQVAPQVSPQAQSNIYWVQGPSGAAAFSVAPGNTVILLDSENPVVYKKSADEHGKPLPMDVYDLVKRESPVAGTAPSTVNLSEYVKKDDLKSFIAEQIDKEMDKRVSQLSFKPATKKKRSDSDEDDEE